MLTDDPLPSGQPNEGADRTLLYFGFTNDTDSSVLGVMDPRRAIEWRSDTIGLDKRWSNTTRC